MYSQYFKYRTKVRPVIESRPNTELSTKNLTSMFDLESKLSTNSTHDDYGSFYES